MSERAANRTAVIAMATAGPVIALVLPLLLLIGFGLTVLAILTAAVLALGAAVLYPVLSRRRGGRDPLVSAFAPTPVVARVAKYTGNCPSGRCQPGMEFVIRGSASELCPAACQALEPMLQRCRQGDDMARERPVFRSRVCEVTFQVYPAL
ncbi:MAG: hypothetical protein HYY01_05270 [Chloroflexi bacterium]|nr:hypothetical protein [Chloroflexota bacterium]